jgi:vacuolar-type H+-ATPase subunit E/Vma4
MAYEDLIKAIEASAEERTREIRQKAENQAEEVVKKAKGQVRQITESHRENAIRRAEIERNRIISGITRDTKLQVIKAKAEILERVYALAEQDLAKSRQRPLYAASFRSFLLESLEEMSGDSVRIHLDPQDEPLCRTLLKELSLDPEIVTDLHCAGGLNVGSKDDTFVILDTIESRFEKARELLRPDVFTILYGG